MANLLPVNDIATMLGVITHGSSALSLVVVMTSLGSHGHTNSPKGNASCGKHVTERGKMGRERGRRKKNKLRKGEGGEERGRK